MITFLQIVAAIVVGIPCLFLMGWCVWILWAMIFELVGEAWQGFRGHR